MLEGVAKCKVGARSALGVSAGGVAFTGCVAFVAWLLSRVVLNGAWGRGRAGPRAPALLRCRPGTLLGFPLFEVFLPAQRVVLIVAFERGLPPSCVAGTPSTRLLDLPSCSPRAPAGSFQQLPSLSGSTSLNAVDGRRHRRRCCGCNGCP